MVMKDFTDTEILYASQLDSLFRNAMVTQGMNTIRQLQDRAITFSVGQIEGWGEAYIDSNGRQNSVVTGNTTGKITKIQMDHIPD